MRRFAKILSTLFCVILMAFGTTQRVVAETHYKAHISLGAHAGATMSRISFSPEVPQSWMPGPIIGIHARYAEEKIVGVMAEFNVLSRGWKENFEDNADLKYSRSLYYFSIPIMTHINFGSPRMKCFFNLGPEFGLMFANHISSNFDYQNTSGVIEPTRRVNQMKMKIANSFDYGITAGVGGEYYLTPRKSIYLEARFYFGLGNIYSATKADEFSASRSMSLEFTAGYTFRLK